jgi:hypothetical protein
MVYTKFKVGDRCKCLHPYAFRGEAPFTITRIKWFKAPDLKARPVYAVKYDDGKIDQIPVMDEGGYKMVLIQDSSVASEAKP